MQTELGVLTVDFVNQKKYHKPLRGKNELIARAVGLHLDCKTLLDATAGLAEDTWTLARLGFQVTALERHFGLFSLLEKAHAEALNSESESLTAQRVQFLHREALEFFGHLQNQAKNTLPDVIYLDPMFEIGNKTAKPKKDMQMLRTLELEATPVLELLNSARKCCRRRVVIKRSLKDPLVDSKVLAQYKGKSIRFDAYNPS